MNHTQKHTICFVVCNPKPNYVRTRTILDYLSNDQNVQLVVAKNTQPGMIRYIQTLWQLLYLRLRFKPDLYILGFRGYEIFALVKLIIGNKPLVFDEYIIAWDYFTTEHKKINPESVFGKLFKKHLVWQAHTADKILCDTAIHGKRSAQVYGIPEHKYYPLYVGTDEETFRTTLHSPPINSRFMVFFYGTFLPLHGVEHIIEAASRLQTNQDIYFVIAGTSSNHQYMAKLTQLLQTYPGTNLQYYPWIEYEKLPTFIEQAALTLGGPFGNTQQAHMVITGKTYQFLAMAKPVVVGKTNDLPGFIHQKNCLLVNQGSTEDLVATIQWAYNHHSTLGQIGQAGKALYQERFSTAAQGPPFIQLLHSLVDKSDQ